MDVRPQESGGCAALLGGRQMESREQAGIRRGSGNCKRRGECEVKRKGRINRT